MTYDLRNFGLTAMLKCNVALDIKAAIFHFGEDQVFATETPGEAEARP